MLNYWEDGSVSFQRLPAGRSRPSVLAHVLRYLCERRGNKIELTALECHIDNCARRTHLISARNAGEKSYFGMGIETEIE
jgi:hypothetical protein